MKHEVQTTAAPVGFWGLLALLFIGLKLGGVITWSWPWVLSPLWLPITVALCFGAVFLTVGLLAEALGAGKDRTR